jgi:hypothetical protein
MTITQTWGLTADCTRGQPWDPSAQPEETQEMTVPTEPRVIVRQALTDAAAYRRNWPDAGDLELIRQYEAMAAELDAGGPVITPEVAARRLLASTSAADFAAETQTFARGGQTPDWLAWAHRLALLLGGLLTAMDAAAPAPAARAAFQAAAIASSGVAPDGSGRLSPADLLTVLGALSDGAVHAGHVQRWNDAAAYRRVSRSLGDDR